MSTTTTDSAPIPILRIVPIDNVHPHEEHDPQRAYPLMERIRQATFFTNPPIVAPMEPTEHLEAQQGRHYVVLDGANRYYCMRHLGYAHLLVQVAAYDSGIVELGVWHHIISQWESLAFEVALADLPGVDLRYGWQTGVAAHVLTREGAVLALDATIHSTPERNQLLRQVVRIYQQNAVLHRTALSDPAEIWPLYPDATAMVLFPQYEPGDIMYAARHEAYLPPGVSRHIIQGRALSLNYPLAVLADMGTSLEAKNAALTQWVQRRLSERAVRFYAESTYQFAE